MLQSGDHMRLTERLRSAQTAREIDLDMNWEQAKLYDGAGFIIAYAYMHDLWRFGAALPAESGDGLKQSAAMMFLYSFDLITVDGPQCDDATAPIHRRDQLFTENRAIADYLRTLPRAYRMQIGTISLGVETATAHVRKNDDVLCSGGLAELSEGLKAQGTKALQQVPNVPGTYGKTYAVPPAPGYQPKFLDERAWRPKQATARQALPLSLTRLLSLPTDPHFHLQH